MFVSSDQVVYLSGSSGSQSSLHQKENLSLKISKTSAKITSNFLWDSHFSKSLRSTEYTAQQSGPRVLELKKTPIPEDEVVVVLEEDAKTHSREDKVVVVLEEDAKSHIREDEVVMVLEEDAETPSHIAGKTK